MLADIFISFIVRTMIQICEKVRKIINELKRDVLVLRRIKVFVPPTFAL